jgi:hypothetical protein
MTKEEFEKFVQPIVDALDNFLDEVVPLRNYGSADDPEMDRFCMVCGSMDGPEDHEKGCPVKDFHQAAHIVLLATPKKEEE